MEDVPAILARIPLFRGVDPAAIVVAPLALRLNRSYRVTSPLGVHVLRLPGVGTETIVDRRAEAANARAAARAGCNAEVLHADPASGVMVCRFIDGAVTLTKARFRERAALARGARTLGRLHRSGVAFSGRLDPFAAIDDYLARLDRLDAPLPAGGAEAIAGVGAVRAALEAHPVPGAPCHVDPSPENFVDGAAGMFLVDYEYAAEGDPMWDLAYFSVEADLDDAREASLLEAYFDGPPPAAEARRVLLYKAVCDLLSALWEVLLAARGHQDLAGDPGARLTRCRALMRTAEFRRQIVPAGGTDPLI